jgi:hypothetical protein
MCCRAPRVFVSYTHDSDSHRRQVLDLVQRLRSDEIDARSDHFVDGTPDGGWPAWMEDEIAQATSMVLICTPTYYARYKQRGNEKSGLGGRWEASLVRDLLYQTSPNDLGKFIPVLPSASSVDDIPDPLRVRVTHYSLSDYEGLLGHLTRRPATSIGRVRSAGRTQSTARPPSGSGDPPQSQAFSSAIKEQYRRIDQRVEMLTGEQFAVISELHGRSRALISGNPGSGKTLVAVEKAIRLADAGLKTLLLCHNPLLANWLSRLTAQSAVNVWAFEDLVRQLAFDPEDVERWSNYSQPTSAQLEGALAALREQGAPFQAVIVDEGQDFADDWWPIVEACLSGGSTLYVFFDERQSLLPGRIRLPAAGWPLTLSRNCRNAGQIYEVMRHLSPGSPPVDEGLRDLGQVAFFQATRLREAVEGALEWCESLGVLRSMVAVLGGGADFDDSVLAHGPFAYEEPIEWQLLVRREMRTLTATWGNELRSAGIEPKDLATLQGLSSGPSPSSEDIRVVRNAAATIAGTLQRRHSHFERPSVFWRAVPSGGSRAESLELRGRKGRTQALELLNAFRCDVWAELLPRTGSVTFGHHLNRQLNDIPVYHLGEIKGLEKNAVLLVLQGDAPQFMHHLFVGISRARAVLAVVGDERAYRALPPWLRPES